MADRSARKVRAAITTTEDPIARVRRRSRQAFRISFVTVLLALASRSAYTTFTFRTELDQFHEACRALVVGETLSAMRDIASEHSLDLSEDDENTPSDNSQIFVIRPTREWPLRYGCRFAARADVIQRIIH